MFIHLLIIAARNLLKNKITSIMSIFGLSIGLTATIIIFIVNYSETTWDSSWPDANRIYKIEGINDYQKSKAASESIFGDLNDPVKEFFPEIEYSGRIAMTPSILSGTNGSLINENISKDEVTISSIDNDILHIFPPKVLKGDLNNFYNDKNSIILSRDSAEKYFGNKDPIGQTLKLKNLSYTFETNIESDYKIVAVIENLPQRSDISCLFINHITPDSSSNDIDIKWRFNTAKFYIKLKDNTQIEAINNKLNSFIDKYVPLTVVFAEHKSSDNFRLSTINIKNVHTQGVHNKDNLQRVWMLSALALAILSLSSINYINLATARGINRQKEVALRKTLGAKQAQIIVQFLTESVLITFLAFLLALIFAEAIIPNIQNNLQLTIDKYYLADPTLIGGLVGIALLIAILAGTYPAFYLSQIKPAKILKANRSLETSTSTRLRKYLVILQFLISGILLSLVVLIAAQLHLVLAYKPGYQTNHILFLYSATLNKADKGAINNLKNQLQKIPEVAVVAHTFSGLPGSMKIDGIVSSLGQKPEDALPIKIIPIADPQEFTLFNISMLAGTSFNENIEPGKQMDSVVLNAQALKNFGFVSAPDAIGKQLELHQPDGKKRTLTIMGVTSYLHLGSYNEPAMPAMFWHPMVHSGTLGIRYNTANRHDLVDRVKSIWKATLGVTPSEMFIEDEVTWQYKNQILISKFIYAFSGIAIIISSMGLYALALLTTQKRTKEIGLRKIHGASLGNIIRLLLWQFTSPILIANAIAWPIALYAMARWLEQFNQRIDLWVWGPIYCALAGLLAVLIAWITVSGHAYLIAREKPAEALREN